MPKKMTKSDLWERVARKAKKVHKDHRDDEVNYGAFTEIPAGVRNGIAKVTECRIGEYKSGTMQGEPFFRMSGRAVSPETQDGEPVAGGITSVQIPLCETPGWKSGGSFEEHYTNVLDEMKKLGVDMENTDADDLESMAKTILELNLFTRFSTRESESGGKTYINHYWNGVTDYEEEESNSGVEDNTGESATVAVVDGENDLDELAKLADDDDATAISSLTETAMVLSISELAITGADSWGDVVDMISNAEVSEKGAEESLPTFEELGEKADEDGDAEAITALKNAAEAHGLDHREYETWVELAVELSASDIMAGLNVDPTVRNTGGPQPEKGEVWYYKPPRKQKKVECEVTAIFKNSEKCNLKNLDDGSSYKSVSWDGLSQEE